MATSDILLLLGDPTRIIPIVGELISNIIKIVHKIVIKVKTVNANKRQCLTLSQRIQRVAEHLQTPEFKKTIYSSGDALQHTLKSFYKFLNECYQFISSFADRRWINRFIHSTDHREKFSDYNTQLQWLCTELTMGMTIKNLINKQQDEQDRLEDLKESLSIINNQQIYMMFLQQALFQQQASRIDQWGKFIINKVDQLKSENQTLKISSSWKDDTTVLEKQDIGFILPSELKDSSVSSSSEEIFRSGTWLNRYFQYGKWHGPFKHQMIFNSNQNKFEGYGEDNVGQFILSGTFSTATNQIDMIQSYKYGTGNPQLNFGHQCPCTMTWNKEKRVFEGIIYVPNGWMIVPGGQFEMSFHQAA